MAYQQLRKNTGVAQLHVTLRRGKLWVVLAHRNCSWEYPHARYSSIPPAEFLRRGFGVPVYSRLSSKVVWRMRRDEAVERIVRGIQDHVRTPAI